MPKPPVHAYSMQFPDDSVFFDADAVDRLILNHGVKMVHWRSMRCPVGLTDPDDVRRPHDHHQNCSNGFLYTRAGTIHCGFLGNSTEKSQQDMGLADGSTVQIVLPRYYDGAYDVDGNLYKAVAEVEVAPFDRFYLDEESITVVHWEVFAAHATGIDRVQFPVAGVTDLVDADGKRYAQGADFDVVEGRIRWRERRPAPNKVCSVRYRYRPYWYVSRMMHEVRVAQYEDETTGAVKTRRMPQQAQLQREYFYEKEMRDKQAPNPDARQLATPPDSLFGPR